MKKYLIGVAIGIIIGSLLMLIRQDYLITKLRISNIENILNQARQRQITQPTGEQK